MALFSKQCNFTITTNGYWANEPSYMEEILYKLMKNGLVSLKISIEKYHLEYVNVQNIKNILNINSKLGLKVVVGCTILKDDKIGGYIRRDKR